MSQELVIETSQKTKKKRNWRLENLPCPFTVRADKEERRELEKLAVKASLSLSRLVVESTLHYGVKSSEDAQAEREVFEQMIFEIRKISVQLKEIMHALNASRRTGESASTEQEIENTLHSIERAIYQLRKRL